MNANLQNANLRCRFLSLCEALLTFKEYRNLSASVGLQDVPGQVSLRAVTW